ncbi:hypothetical protein MKZ38_006932 [Zalerion maritima]|uniref:VLRF1 domain-containing protein n=1 Tax=Zalerion maritima TaxID=339359 RepID=A0AAD5RV49_9PEZI|nr:hypothetical protein MKZ38_006932 [Zalerion maritima]
MATPGNKTEKAQNDLLRRPLYFYDLPAEVLSTLSYTPNQKLISTEPVPVPEAKIESQSEPQIEEPSQSSATTSSKSSEFLGSQSCALCSQTFSSLPNQRSHLRSDLHHYNLKQKLRGRKPATEDEFEKLIETLDESLSGSDSSTDEDEDETAGEGDDSPLAILLKRKAKVSPSTSRQADEDPSTSQPKTRLLGNSPLLWLSSPKLPANHYFGAHKALFSTTDLASPINLMDVIKSKQLTPINFPKSQKGLPTSQLPPVAYNSPHIFLCMTGGGHFAAMVVSLAPHAHSKGTTLDREATVLAHKTFHKYTTRRKQGGAQSANDNAKGKAKSIGAQIRRANEQALADDIRALIKEWKPLIASSELLFVRATGAQNRRVLFGSTEGDMEEGLLKTKDERLRGFPFSTGRATQKELMRCFIELTRLKIREIVPVEPEREKEKEKEKMAEKQSTQKKPTKEEKERNEELETAMLHTTQMQSMIKRSKLPALLAYLRNNELSPNFRFEPSGAQGNAHAPTPLHLAAAQGAALIVGGLLGKAGADPTVRSKEGKTPFEISSDRATRDAFRVARGELGEEKWDWDNVAKVPPALSKGDVEKRVRREKDEEEERKREELKRVEMEQTKKGADLGKQRGVMQSTKGPSWEEQAKGMTPEMRMRLQREQRARAAEERLKRM